MPSNLEALVRLERRLIVIEAALGIDPPAVDLIHPKALSQAKAEAVRLAAKIEKEEKP
jgi:hypothetical protein